MPEPGTHLIVPSFRGNDRTDEWRFYLERRDDQWHLVRIVDLNGETCTWVLRDLFSPLRGGRVISPAPYDSSECYGWHSLVSNSLSRALRHIERTT